MSATFLYHSFPRPRAGETHRELLTRGWRILQAIRGTGLILAPEVVTWSTPVSIGSPSPIRILQQRTCFTELRRSELPGHSEHFGPFAIEFGTTSLRRAGALPVIYMPQALSEHDHLALLGPFIVGHLGHIEHMVRKLNDLRQWTDLDHLRQQNPDAERIDEDCVVNLQSGDKQRGIIQESAVPLTAVRDILDYVGFENAPFTAMIGSLSIARSLFYPTDNEHDDVPLAYYRQREWRIAGNFSMNNKPRARPLLKREQQQLLEIDGDFWKRKLSFQDDTFRRVDKAMSLTIPPSEDVLSMITRLVVPSEFLEQSQVLFPGVTVETQST